MSEGYKITPIGELPYSWEVSSLKEVAEVMPSNVDKKIHPGEQKVRLCNYMDVYKNNYIKDSLELSEGSATSAEIDKFLLKQGDVIITKDSETKEDIAQSAAVLQNFDDVLCGYHLALIRPQKKKVDGVYLAKLFEIPQVRKQLVNKANGTTRFGLSIGTINELIIPVPELKEQQKIAEILSTVDEKIEVIEEQINQITELKKGLMQQLLTKGIGHTQFKDSPLGDIPESWEVVELNTVFKKVVVGFVGSISSHYCLAEDGIPFIRTLNVKDGYFDLNGIEYVTHEFHNKNKKSQIANNDILIARVGANMGLVCRVDGLESEANAANVIIIKGEESACSEFFSNFLSSEGGQKQIHAQGIGGAQEVFNTTLAKRLKIPLPPFKEQKAIAEVLTVVKQKIEVLQDKRAYYHELKKGLMQQLLTGKLRVNQLIESEVMV